MLTMVMDSTLLEIASRRAPFQVDLSDALKVYIESNYQQNASQFIQDVAELQRLRDAAVSAVSKSPPDSLTALSQYYTQLIEVVPKFPAAIGTDLVWSNSLGYATAPVHSKSLQFDRINIGYNIAAHYTQWAYLVTGSDYKQAFKLLQNAAGAFQHILETDLELLPHQPPIGLDPVTIECLLYLFLAQAQEVFWAKARNDDVKSSILAKLSQGTADLYTKARSFTDKTSAVTAEFVVHIQAKIGHFAATAQYRQSLDCLNRGQYGEEVARLQEALKICNETLRDFDQNPRNSLLDKKVVSNLTGLRDKVSHDLQRAEKDNDLIYLQIIPNRLAPIVKSIVAKALVPDEMIHNLPSKPLFQLLLPFNISQAPLAYKERLDKYVRNHIIEELESLDAQATSKLAELELPGALDMIDSSSSVPLCLIHQHEELKNTGGLALLQRSSEDLSKLANSSEQRLSAAKSAIDKKTLHGRYYNEEDYNELVSVYEQLHGYITTSMASDATVRSKITNNEHLLGILIAGREAIVMFLPRGNNNMSRETVNDGQVVRAIVNQIQGSIARRRHVVQQVTVKLQNTDLTTPMFNYAKTYSGPLTEPNQLEPVYTKILGKFDEELNNVRTEKRDFTKNFANLEARFAEFKARLGPSTESDDERTNAANALQHAYYQYKEIAANLEEGRKFYNALASRIATFEEQIQDFISDIHTDVEDRPIPGSFIYKHDTSSSSSAESLSANPPIAIAADQEAGPSPSVPTPGQWHPGMEIKFA